MRKAQKIGDSFWLALVFPRPPAARLAYLTALVAWIVGLATHDGVDLFGLVLGVGCGVGVLTVAYWFCWLLLMLVEDCL